MADARASTLRSEGWTDERTWKVGRSKTRGTTSLPQHRGRTSRRRRRVRVAGGRDRDRPHGACVRRRGPRARARAGLGGVQARGRRWQVHGPRPRVRPRGVREGRRPCDRRGPPGARPPSAVGHDRAHYPFCWRCSTPLLYYARPSWYVRTTAVKERLLQVNDEVHWYPDHIKRGRYGNWLENNVDWALSRERYWGTPLPIWRCTEGTRPPWARSPSSARLAGRDFADLDPHRPTIDEIAFPCPACGAEARRVPEVIDAWYDSGAMPFAQWGSTPSSTVEEAFVGASPRTSSPRRSTRRGAGSTR